jgi:hypothetical protein
MEDLIVDASQDLISLEALSVFQFRAGTDSLLPRLEFFQCKNATKSFIPFIPLLLSGRTTSVEIVLTGNLPIVTVALTIVQFPTLCPNIRNLYLLGLPIHPVVTEAVSEMLLACNRDTLQHFYVDSPLAEEACKVLYNLPNLNVLLAFLRGPTSIPESVVLPNLAMLRIEYDHGSDWSQIFHRATIGELKSVLFVPSGSAQVDGLLEKFQNLAPSAQDTLSSFYILTAQSWSPNYSSILTFTQLKLLRMDFSCHNGCSSQVDDDIVVSIARAMPGLEHLRLGSAPCSNPTGIALDGLIALANHCPHLSVLCVHLHAEELAQATTRGEQSSSSKHEVTIPRTDCTLTDICVGEAPVSPQAVWTVSLTLLQIFPQIRNIIYTNPQWKSVVESIELSKKIRDHIHRKSKMPPCPL